MKVQDVALRVKVLGRDLIFEVRTRCWELQLAIHFLECPFPFFFCGAFRLLQFRPNCISGPPEISSPKTRVWSTSEGWWRGAPFLENATVRERAWYIFFGRAGTNLGRDGLK